MKMIFYVGTFITFTMLNCFWFMIMANKLNHEYSSVGSLMLDAGVTSLGITFMLYGIFGVN